MADSPCLTCKKPSAPAYHPFCSKRCADVDLGRWFNESYAIESHTAPTDEEDSVPETLTE